MGTSSHVAVAQLAGAREPSVLGLGVHRGWIEERPGHGAEILTAGPGGGGSLGGGAVRSRLLLELLAACGSGDQRPLSSAQNPQGGAAMIQNVGNHLRRVRNGGLGWTGNQMWGFLYVGPRK